MPIYAQCTILLDKTQHPYFSGLIPNFWLLSYKSTQFVFCRFASKLFTPHWDVYICEIRKSFRIRGSILNTDHKCDDWFIVQHQLQPMRSHEWVHFGCRLWRTAPTFTTGSSTLAPARTLQRAAESSASSGASATFKPPGMDGWQVKVPGVGAGWSWRWLGYARIGRVMFGFFSWFPFPAWRYIFLQTVSTLRGSYGRG